MRQCSYFHYDHLPQTFKRYLFFFFLFITIACFELKPFWKLFWKWGNKKKKKTHNYPLFVVNLMMNNENKDLPHYLFQRRFLYSSVKHFFTIILMISSWKMSRIGSQSSIDLINAIILTFNSIFVNSFTNFIQKNKQCKSL